jgi:hypothetical protein
MPSPQLIPKPGQPRVIHRKLTRGMGPNMRLVASGGGGFRKFIEFIKQKAGDGAKYVKDGLEEVIVWAKLIRINEQRPEQNIQGYVKIGIDKARRIAVSLAGSISTKARNIFNDIKITINRIK